LALRILIIPDKFKGTCSATAVAECIAGGWQKARPNDALIRVPMSDGGEGFGEVTSRFSKASTHTIKSIDAAHRPCRADWWWQSTTKTALIETARVIGLAMLPLGRFHPFELDTYGLGTVFKAAARKGARRCVVGIGGSATNDGGFGFARAIGWRFLDDASQEIENWRQLKTLESICAPKNRLPFKEVRVAVDVQNPLLGPRGATRVYGPQKGLRPRDFADAEAALARLATVWEKQFHHRLSSIPGAGAAGGLGFGLMAFLGARLQPGFELFAHHARLEKLLRASDLVITGEGAIDNSTLMGKGVGQLAALCRKWKIPCIAIAGMVNGSERLQNSFAQTHSLSAFAGVEKAKAHPQVVLKQLGQRVASSWSAALK
jgi:glycerate 2-kinase